MSYNVINPYQTFYDSTGQPRANGTVTFYVNTTTTLGSIYSDEALTVTQSNPYTLDAFGRITGDVKYSGLMTLSIANSDGSDVVTIDNVATINSSTLSEWQSATTAARASTTTFTVTGDLTTTFIEGQFCKATGGADRIFTVDSSSYSSPNTTVTCRNIFDTSSPPVSSTLHASMDTVYINILSPEPRREANSTAYNSYEFNQARPKYAQVDYLAIGDGTTDDRTSLFNANADGDFVLEPGTYSVQSALTLSNKVTFLPGAILKPASGITITISGKIDAGQYQIFDISAGGTITPSGGVAPCIYAEWYVTDMTGATLMGNELRAACEFARIGQIPLEIGTGTILVDKDGANSYAIHFYGIDVRGTLCKSTLTPGGSVIKLADSQDCDVIQFDGFSNSCLNIAVDGNRTNQTASNLRGFRYANYYNGNMQNLFAFNVKGYGHSAISTVSDGPNACYARNLFATSCDHGMYVDTNASGNQWDMLGFQTINDGGTGTNDEFGMVIQCTDNVFGTIYFESIGTSGGAGTSALMKWNSARGNTFLRIKNQSVTPTWDYGIYTPTSGAGNSYNRVLGARNLTGTVKAILMDNFTLDNQFYNIDGCDPSTDYQDSPSKNHFYKDGSEYANYRAIGNVTTYAVDNRKNFKLNTNLTGTFLNWTGTNYAGYEIFLWADTFTGTIDMSGGGNIRGNNGINYTIGAGDYIRFIYDGTYWHAFISQG